MAFGVGQSIGSTWLVPVLTSPGQNLWTANAAATVWNDWYFGTAPSGVAGVKVWMGSAWVEKPAKVWTGSAWTAKPVKTWNGSAWV
jgi:hypothetical protein